MDIKFINVITMNVVMLILFKLHVHKCHCPHQTRHKVGIFKIELSLVCKRPISEEQMKQTRTKLDEYSLNYAIFIIMHIQKLCKSEIEKVGSNVYNHFKSEFWQYHGYELFSKSRKDSLSNDIICQEETIMIQYAIWQGEMLRIFWYSGSLDQGWIKTGWQRLYKNWY